MDGPREYYIKSYRKDKKTYRNDNNTSESMYRAGTDSQTQKTNLGLPQWKGLERGMNEGYGIKSNVHYI